MHSLPFWTKWKNFRGQFSSWTLWRHFGCFFLHWKESNPELLRSSLPLQTRSAISTLLLWLWEKRIKPAESPYQIRTLWNYLFVLLLFTSQFFLQWNYKLGKQVWQSVQSHLEAQFALNQRNSIPFAALYWVLYSIPHPGWNRNFPEQELSRQTVDENLHHRLGQELYRRWRWKKKLSWLIFWVLIRSRCGLLWTCSSYKNY